MADRGPASGTHPVARPTRRSAGADLGAAAGSGEELFSADAGPQASKFLELLVALLRGEAGITPGLIVAVTVRADRYEPLQTAPGAGVQSVLFNELKPMPPAGFTEVITSPADHLPPPAT